MRDEGRDENQTRVNEALDDLARRLHEARRRSEMSQEAVALSAGIAVETYRRLEAPGDGDARYNPTVGTILRVMTVLDLDGTKWAGMFDPPPH